MYRIFDNCIASELDLPGLVACVDEIADWSITLPQGELDEDGYEWFHAWKAPDGQELMSCARKGENYLLNLWGLAQFVIHFDQQRIEAWPQAACTENTLAHLLQDQVIPRVICHGGRMVMHASAVVLQDGRAVAFTGPSGRGKSTLASAFYQAGHRLVTDDCLLLENRGGVVCAVPAYPSLRLWPDSASEFSSGERARARFSDMAHYSPKKQLLFEPAEQPEKPEWLELSALFVLAEPPGPADSGQARLEPLGGTMTVMAIIEALFALDVASKEAVQRNFEVVRRVAGGMPVFRLSYPRTYEVLPEVLDLVERGNPVYA